MTVDRLIASGAGAAAALAGLVVALYVLARTPGLKGALYAVSLAMLSRMVLLAGATVLALRLGEVWWCLGAFLAAFLLSELVEIRYVIAQRKAHAAEQAAPPGASAQRGAA